MYRVGVWGTGNMGRSALRAIDAHPELELAGVIVHDPAKVGRDAADIAELRSPTGVACTDDVASVLDSGLDALAYTASGDFRPDESIVDVERCLRAGITVVTPSLYPLYDPATTPADLKERMVAASAMGKSALFASGIDPGWGNDVLPAMLTGLCARVDSVRAQEIFDYSFYDQPDAVRHLVGMGLPMDADPPMVAPTVPTMVWGSSVRMIARALAVELDEIREHVERRPLERTVINQLGTFEAGTQGALRFEVQGIVGGEPRIVVEHVTRIDPQCAPDWPQPTTGAGSHRVVIEGSPRLVVTVEAEEEGGNRAAGGNATAGVRLVAAIPWLCEAPPGIYDALDVPIVPARGRMSV
jgi:2,4-diaminopentanoate dehydrogenase